MNDTFVMLHIFGTHGKGGMGVENDLYNFLSFSSPRLEVDLISPRHTKKNKKNPHLYLPEGTVLWSLIWHTNSYQTWSNRYSMVILDLFLQNNYFSFVKGLKNC